MMRPLPSLFRWMTVSLAIAVMATRPAYSQSAAPGTITGPGATTPVDPTALEQLLPQVDNAIEFNSRRFLEANRHSPWQIFHGILALRQKFLVKLGDRKVSAIEWIATSEPRFDNEPLLVLTDFGGNFHPFTRPYVFQGHPAQFLALLTQSDLPPTFEFKVQGKTITIADMLRDTMMNTNSKEEITWILWALNHYYPVDTQWVNKFGEAWSIERLVQTQNQAIVEKGACGGNHGLFALARARDKYIATGAPLRGVWLEADQKIKRYITIARTLQNTDGTFSSKSYQGPEYSTDINTRLNTTGHTMEFLSAAISEQQLKEQWARNAVYVLSKDLIDHRHAPVDCGPLYHSLNSLMIYRDRVRAATTVTAMAKPISDTKRAIDSPPRPMILLPAPFEPQWRNIDAPASALQPINR